MPDDLDALFATAVLPKPAPRAPAATGPVQGPPDDLDELFGTVSPPPRAVEPAPEPPPEVEPATPDGIGGYLSQQLPSLAALFDRAGAGKEAAVTSMVRGVAGAGDALGLVDQATVAGASADAANAERQASASDVAGATKFGVGLAPWMLGPAGMALGAVDVAGNRRLDVLEQGGSETKANVAGLVDGALAIAIPKVLGKLVGPLSGKIGDAIAERLGPEAGRIAVHTIQGAATGAGLGAGSAAVSAGTGDTDRAIQELWSIPKQALTLGLLGGGHQALREVAQRAPGGAAAPQPIAPPAAPVQTADGIPAGLGAGRDVLPPMRADQLPPEPVDTQAQLAALFHQGDYERAPRAVAPDAAAAPVAAEPRAEPSPAPAPTEPAAPAPNAEVPRGQVQVEAEGQAQALPETVLSPELQPGAAVHVRAGRQFLDGEVLSTAADGTVAVRLADGRTMTGVPSHRVLPMPKEATDAGRGERAGADRPAAVAASDQAPVQPRPAPADQPAPAAPAVDQVLEPRGVRSGEGADRGLKQVGTAQPEPVGEPLPPRPAPPRRVPVAEGVPLKDAGALRARAEAAARGELDQPKPAAGDETRVDRPAVKREQPTATPEAARIDQAAAAADTAPTEGQKEAGNYQKGHVRIHGLDITIENPRGSERSGTDANGKPWSVEMPDHYGYVRRTEGADGDHVDVYIGPHPEAGRVYVVDQIDPRTGKFDEHKAMLGYDSQEAATAAYDAAFSDSKGPERRGAVTPMPITTFKRWLERGSKKPVAFGRRAKVEAAPAAPPADAGRFLPPDRDPAVKHQQKADFKADAEPAKIADFGEKLGGARKDRLSLDDLDRMSSEERQTAVTKAAVWKERDHAAAIASGQPAEVAHLVQQVRGAIATKPVLDRTEASDPAKRDAAIRDYVETVSKLRDRLDAARTHEDINRAFRETFPGLFSLHGPERLRNPAVHETREAAGARYRHVATTNALAKVAQVDYKARRRAEKAVAEGWPGAEPWTRRYEVQRNLVRGDDGQPKERFYVRAKAFEQRVRERSKEQEDAFDSRAEADAEAARRYEALVAEGGGGSKKPPTRPLNPDAKRVGADRRGERDVKPEDFARDFGFRGTEFGNWTNQADRQQSLNQAFEGLHDLAELLGVPPAALSLEGKLGLAFGARGSGKNAAHYEPGRVVINLTRTKGSGSLAHEWAHAVDNLFGKAGFGGEVDRWLSHATDQAKAARDAAGKVGVRPEIVEAWAAIHRAIHGERGRQTTYLLESRKADKGKEKPYWSNEHELFARAFETWANQRLADAGKSSPYLVEGVPTQEGTKKGYGDSDWMKRYPQGEEADRINAAVDRWVDELMTEQTPEGKTRLFAPERVPGEEPAEGERIVEPLPPEADAADEPKPPREDEPLQMPDPKEGIESLIAWALKQREAGIEDLRKVVERGGSMVDEAKRDLAEHEAITPEALAKDMREYPQHYLRLMTERGGNLSAIGVYRNRIQLPPQQPRVQVAPLPLPAGEAPDLRGTLRQLRDGLQKAAPSAPTFNVDKGALPDEAGGSFDTRTRGIVTRHHNDLDLVAHEVGHWASETYGLLPAESSREMRAELARFAVHGSPARGETAQREGMAEFLRAWMVDPGTAETRAPLFAQHMREKVPPAVLEALRGYGDSVRRFEGATALQKMAAGQQRTTAALEQQKREGRWYTPLWQGVKEFLGKGIGEQKARVGVIPTKWKASAKDKAVFHLDDKEAPQLSNYLTAMTLVGMDPAKVSPSQHWDFLRKGMRGVAAKVRDGVTRFGLPNPDGTVAKDPATGEPMAMPWLLASAPKDAAGFAAFLDKAHAYGSAQRTVELADRFTVRAEEEISRFAEDQVKATGGDKLRMGAAERTIKAFAEERRKALRMQLARLTAAGGGIRSATEVARDAIAELHSDPQRDAIEKYLARYRAWADWNLQYAVDAELLSPDQAETIRQANQFYIDWHRVFADEDGPVNLGEAVQGSSRTMHNPLASLLHATWSTVTRGDRNRAMNAFVAPLRMQPKAADGIALSQLGRKISQEAADEAATKHHGYHDDGTGQKARVYHTQRLIQETMPDGTPVTGRDGTPIERVETEHWTFDPATEASLEAMRAESGEDPWTKINQGLVNLQRLAITSAPAFRYKVPVRDNLERLLNTEAGSGIGDIVRGQRRTLTDPLTGEELEVDRLYHQSGAGMAGWNRRTREQALADVFAHVEDSRKKGVRWLTPGGAWRAWQHFGEVSENIARKAEFVAAYRKGRLERGYSQLDASLYAMTEARGLLDTAQSGYTVGRLNRFFLFLNAAEKGLARTTKLTRAAAAAYARGDTATGHRLAGTMAIRLGVWGASLAGLRLAFLAMLDDDKQEELLGAPNWKRDFAMTVPDFGMGKIAIPKPYEWGWIGSGFERLADGAWATGRAAAARAAGDEEAAQRWSEHASRAGEGWGRSGVTALLPLKFDDVLGGGLAPIAEVGFSRSLFTDAPIIPQHELDRKLELRDTSSASAIGQALSPILAPVLGDRFGDPRSIDHLIRGYLGGWGTTGTARDFGEVARRFTGYSGETSPYAERDVRYVLDWAAKEGVATKKPFNNLRSLVKAARDAKDEDRAEAMRTMRRAAQAMRRTIDENPTSAFGAEAKQRAKAAADE